MERQHYRTDERVCQDSWLCCLPHCWRSYRVQKRFQILKPCSSSSAFNLCFEDVHKIGRPNNSHFPSGTLLWMTRLHYVIVNLSYQGSSAINFQSEMSQDTLGKEIRITHGCYIYLLIFLPSEAFSFSLVTSVNFCGVTGKKFKERASYFTKL
jgi:hypothetical protein